MNVLEAWELGYTGRGIKITIMDDGIDYTHPDLFVTYVSFIFVSNFYNLLFFPVSLFQAGLIGERSFFYEFIPAGFIDE